MRYSITIRIIKMLRGLAFAAGAVLIFGNAASIPVVAQQLFASPEEAVKALTQAAKAKDHETIAAIFGPRVRDFVSGDAVEDKYLFDQFTAEITTASKFEKASDKSMTLVVGEDDWPFPAPIVKAGDKWKFDTDAGVEEMLNRRIGMNEFFAMHLSEAYALAQYEYFNGDDQDGDQVSEYAQKISSSEGKRDGLFWEKASADEEESPLGELFAYAAVDGYKAQKGTAKSAAPFYGYNFKVLYRQGASAPGGKYDYIINGNMIGGFALVAYPATWGNSGVMTFIVNQEGRVYEKNLGPRTGVIASAMTDYDPDVSWELVDLD